MSPCGERWCHAMPRQKAFYWIIRKPAVQRTTVSENRMIAAFMVHASGSLRLTTLRRSVAGPKRFFEASLTADGNYSAGATHGVIFARKNIPHMRKASPQSAGQGIPSEDMVSHVLSHRKHLAADTLALAPSRIGYSLRIVHNPAITADPGPSSTRHPRGAVVQLTGSQ
jgi:hypothetical protein